MWICTEGTGCYVNPEEAHTDPGTPAMILCVILRRGAFLMPEGQFIQSIVPASTLLQDPAISWLSVHLGILCQITPQTFLDSLTMTHLH